MAQWIQTNNIAGGWQNLETVGFLTVQGPDTNGHFHVATSGSGGDNFPPDFDTRADAQAALDAFVADQGTVTL